MTFNEFLTSKKFSYFFYVILIIALILIVFRAGMVVGSRNASLFFERQERQQDARGGPPIGRPFGSFMNDPFGPSHGTFGTIESIATTSATGTTLLEIKESNGDEKTVVVGSSTTLVGSQISKNDQAVVIGSPNDQGEIEARFVRIFQNNATSGATTTNSKPNI